MIYAIIDIETTGGKFNEERITEIAIYKFQDKKLSDQLHTLVNSVKKIQPFIQNLTGITDKMLKNKPKFIDISEEIIDITSNCILVAHNANFDYRVLRNEFTNIGVSFNRKTLCTIELSKELLPGRDSYSLGKLAKSLGIKIENRHRANGDAMATLKLLKILLEKDKGNVIEKLTK
ncbi:MAG TPA: 3'-5' exonuclease [Flavobacteriaceae bacterium]|nr:3'-5' exonuclease [Flavobacteriaceae bacterium]